MKKRIITILVLVLGVTAGLNLVHYLNARGGGGHGGGGGRGGGGRGGGRGGASHANRARSAANRVPANRAAATNRAAGNRGVAGRGAAGRNRAVAGRAGNRGNGWGWGNGRFYNRGGWGFRNWAWLGGAWVLGNAIAWNWDSGWPYYYGDDDVLVSYPRDPDTQIFLNNTPDQITVAYGNRNPVVLNSGDTGSFPQAGQFNVTYNGQNATVQSAAPYIEVYDNGGGLKILPHD